MWCKWTPDDFDTWQTLLNEIYCYWTDNGYGLEQRLVRALQILSWKPPSILCRAKWFNLKKEFHFVFVSTNVRMPCLVILQRFSLNRRESEQFSMETRKLNFWMSALERKSFDKNVWKNWNVFSLLYSVFEAVVRIIMYIFFLYWFFLGNTNVFGMKKIQPNYILYYITNITKSTTYLYLLLLYFLLYL